MADAKEQEIRRQFLEEAQEYVEQIESEILHIRPEGNPPSRLDAILRAAHSIKGGAAMMGFASLSNLAHRLEDFFKVLKAGTEINADLEGWFFKALDSLQQVINNHRQGLTIDDSWLETQVNPIFDYLSNHLGQPQPAAPEMMETVAEDMVMLLFETEVESCLNRLTTVLESPEQPCLKEEFLIAAQELASLGEMLQLSSFSELCNSIVVELEQTNEGIATLARDALQKWRQFQAEILTGQVAEEFAPPELTLPEPINSLEPEPLEANTVRVTVPQLEQLSELFGEMTIERNGLELQLKRLRSYLGLLQQRVKVLEEYNYRLRSSYDKPLAVTSATTNSNYGHLFDEIELDRYGTRHSLATEIMETIVQIQEVSNDLQINLEETEAIAIDLHRTSKLMQNQLTQVRMRPLSDLLRPFPRALREMSQEYGKSVELQVKGGSTLIDKTIFEALKEPLLHLLRNAFAHGIEEPTTRENLGKSATGLITINASHRGNRTIITIQDDGRGIDLDKIRQQALAIGLEPKYIDNCSEQDLLELIFEPGFSTATQVNDLAGRGVGMDIVRTNLRRVQGTVQVETQPGQGTTFKITVPFTLSVVRVFLAEAAGLWMAFPTNAIEEVILLDPTQVINTTGQEVLNWEGYLLPILRLAQWLKFPAFRPLPQPESAPVIAQPTVLIVAENDHLFGLAVDRYWGEQEVTIRQVEGQFPLPAGFSGCTILGDGRVVPLVDATTLINSMTKADSAAAAAPGLKTLDHNPVPGVMVVDDSVNVRRFLALTLEKAGYRVEQAKDGQEALEKLQTPGVEVEAVLCDLEMPRLDGYGFLSQLQAEPWLSKLPVIMITSRSGAKHRQLAFNLGAAAYFTKPFKEQELLSTLGQLLFKA